MLVKEINLTLMLTPDAIAWLEVEANESGASVTHCISGLLNALASPETNEDTLVDALLEKSRSYFPRVMTLDEQDELQEEVIDFLCMRIIEVNSNSVFAQLSATEVQDIRDKLVRRSKMVWISQPPRN